MPSSLSDLVKKLPPCSSDELHLARGHYLDHYSSLESMLGSLMGQALVGHDPGENNEGYVLSYFIFTRIVNNNSRRQIIQRVMEHTAKGKFAEFRDSFVKQMKQVDDFRNRLAHRAIRTRKNGDGQTVAVLIPPQGSDGFIHKQQITDQVKRTKALFDAAQAFHSYYSNADWRGLSRARLRRVFGQKIRYPLPAEHPLRTNL